jgi:hypothetical protein
MPIPSAPTNVCKPLKKLAKKYLQKKVQTQVFKINTPKPSYLKAHALKKDTSQQALVKFGTRYAQQMGRCGFVTSGFPQSILHRLPLQGSDAGCQRPVFSQELLIRDGQPQGGCTCWLGADRNNLT